MTQLKSLKLYTYGDGLQRHQNSKTTKKHFDPES